jgi:hypothetical protein
MLCGSTDVVVRAGRYREFPYLGPEKHLHGLTWDAMS